MEQKIIVVCAGIVIRDDKILIAQRKSSCSLAPDKWEFPGGKVEFGEDPKNCIVREIEEELEIVAQSPRLFHITSHIYDSSPNKNILLIFYLLDYLSGEINLLDCQDAKWIELFEIKNYDFAKADVEAVDMISRGVLNNFV